MPVTAFLQSKPFANVAKLLSSCCWFLILLCGLAAAIYFPLMGIRHIFDLF